MIQIKRINVGLYGIAIKEGDIAKWDVSLFKKNFLDMEKSYVDRHTYVGYVIVMYESPEIRDRCYYLAKALGYRTAVKIPEVLMVEGRSLRE